MKETAEEVINKPNAIIYFYMEGCPYCIKTTPIWNELTNQYRNKYQFFKIESQDINSNLKDRLGITGFPHFVINKNGKQMGYPGSVNSLKELEDKLQLSKSSGGTRRRKLLGRRRRSTRKLRNTIRKRT